MTNRHTRRMFISGVATVGATALAGCVGTQNGSSDDDESDAVGSDGLVFVFGPDRLSLADPETGAVVEERTEGFENASWAEAQLTHDESTIFAVDSALDQVHVFDTETRTHEAAVDVGRGANHLHHPTDDEVWVYADTEGALYAIDTTEYEVIEVIEAGLEGAGHGKLLHHEDFGETAYATNVDDPGLAVIDLPSYERTEFLEFGEGGGTHYKAYSPSNGLAYIEYLTGTTVVDPADGSVVDELEYNGGMYLSPDESILAVTDDDVHFVDVTDEESNELGAVKIDGGPSSVRYDRETENAFVVAAEADEMAVIDLDDMTEVDRLDIGTASGRSRIATPADQYILTPADESVAVIDSETRTVEMIEVDGTVETIQYVGDAGPGYSGGIR